MSGVVVVDWIADLGLAEEASDLASGLLEYTSEMRLLLLDGVVVGLVDRCWEGESVVGSCGSDLRGWLLLLFMFAFPFSCELIE